MKILTALKHLFIPHEHNNYRPHFFREISVAIIVVSSIFLLGFSAGSSFLIHRTVLGASVAADVLVDLTNESRLALNVAPLTRNPMLDQVATLKADDMSAKGYFAHTSPEGITPWYWFQQVGYVFLYAGENLAINFTDSKEIEDAWLKSPSHRANLLNINFKEIGLATVSGVYNNGPTIYVVQEFGTPAVTKPVEASTTPVAVATTTPAESKPAQVTTKNESPVILAERTNAPEIKGESTGTKATTSSETPTNIVPIITSPSLAVVKNTDTVEAPAVPAATTYSTWYGRLLFFGSGYVDTIYKILLAIILIALMTMLIIELQKQHWKHIAYGLALFLIITLCLLINQVFF